MNTGTKGKWGWTRGRDEEKKIRKERLLGLLGLGGRLMSDDFFCTRSEIGTLAGSAECLLQFYIIMLPYKERGSHTQIENWDDNEVINTNELL